MLKLYYLFYSNIFNPGPIVVERVIVFTKSPFQPIGRKSVILLYKNL